MNKPIRHSYWVEPGKLLAGEYPRDKDEQLSKNKIKALLDSGVAVFIDLTAKDEGLLPYSYLIGSAAHYRFPIRDMSIPKSSSFTKEIIDTIDSCIELGKMVYVHCLGGVGRTGVIIGCWLAGHSYKGEAALTRLHELWLHCPKSVNRQSPETYEQKQYILDWKADR